MPIISAVGRRTWKVRLVIGLVYAVLIFGAMTMIYPLLLMLSGSVTSEADFASVAPLPQYLFDDQMLWAKYLESKYALIPTAKASLHRDLTMWQSARTPALDADALARAQLFREFRESVPWPREWYMLGHSRSNILLAKNARLFRRAAQRRFNGSLADWCAASGIDYPSWSHVGPPRVDFAARNFTFPQSASYELYYDLKSEAPRADWAVVNLDGEFWVKYLLPAWGTVEAYNDAHGTRYTSYDQVLLSPRPPANTRERDDWEDYVRNQLGLAFVRVDPSAADSFRSFVRRRVKDIAELNRLWNSQYGDFAGIPMPLGVPQTARARADFAEFIRDHSACPLEMLSVHGPRQGFEEFVAARQRVRPANVGPLPLPLEVADYLDFREQKPSLRWEFLRRNYLCVWDYLWTHGRGIRNTAIYCGLVVLTSLLVNPLAAYALSRYRPPSTYAILLFCMATMAFPAEVTMIPSFLLLKRFPLMHIAAGAIAGLVAAWLLSRFARHRSDAARGIIAGLAGIATGYWLSPWLAHHLLGRSDGGAGTVSLLNTFWALVLPAAANGFSIFLLKGFFDSLPRELYEAADLDGAGEWTKFWLITMNLSKPILAVLALTAFTVAYGEFMMALVIIPDPSMWTLMVWLYQLQAWSHPSVVYASLVIAAVPPMLIFVAAQRAILRGIVVPSEK